ncbi:polyprenyl synthetase family protein [Nocardioides sp. HDW12B]|uniref:polyprenyl synthetase family protein n=1 Tax=Nocardioides sp. HDW12B TaxID=2714939 RepID=UPI00140BB95D|nr:polyprenyl synthetase family protein [Nocardioides sp. HDW12B]QIK65999.1 polyprenyl synthetase family protein [Nocardioides sp. HDW12B]
MTVTDRTGPASTTADATARTLAAAHELTTRRVQDVTAVLAGVEGDPRSPALGGFGLDLAAELARWTDSQGKQVRAVVAHHGFVVAGGRATSPDADGLASLGSALELLHLFALVHDDVMDRSRTRRGLETTHERAARRHREAAARGDAERYGDGVAILLGDLLLAEASAAVASLPEAVRIAWRHMVLELVHGQLLDLTATAAGTDDPAVTRVVARLKTGRYTVRRPLELGALLVTDDASLLEVLGRWGDLVGDAFGLRDDVLGVWGDPGRTGKPALDDLVDGRATTLLAWARDMVTGSDAPLVEACSTGELDRDDAVRLADALVRNGVRDRAERAIDALLAEAAEVADGLPHPAARGALAGLAARLARRTR